MSAANLDSIAPFLPLESYKGSLRWTSSAEYALKAVARGPETSQVRNAGSLLDCIDDIRSQIGDLRPLSSKAAVGLSTLCDEVHNESEFFTSTIPAIAKLAVELPTLLEHHVREIGRLSTVVLAPLTLRVLSSQKPGIVLLHQHVIAALLACAFFCLYPDKRGRWKLGLVNINFDGLYLGVANGLRSNLQKLLCLIHYFKKVGYSMPQGTVSFERKVLYAGGPSIVSSFAVPNERFWTDSQHPLCEMKVMQNGAIEDAGSDYLQVDFANQQLGGGVLHSGCVQEEIRFTISPECIAGILFIPTMTDNESIEIIGAETYSQYEGYGPSFCFAGDHNDKTPRDSFGRRKTCIGAIDALCRPGEDQFKDELMIRELNKAYCGFLNHSTFCGHGQAENLVEGVGSQENSFAIQDSQAPGPVETAGKFKMTLGGDSFSGIFVNKDEKLITDRHCKVEPTDTCKIHQTLIGVATGNWGAGAFGGNLHLKSLLQWLAASQAGCSMILYYSFRDSRSQRLQELVDWIQKEKWCVSELWSILQEYGQCRINGQVNCDLYEWILPLEKNLVCRKFT